MRRLLLCLSLLITMQLSAQDFSNKGKDFYLCFPQHVPNSTANLATLSIFITSDLASSGTISMANAAFNGTFNIAANGIQEIQIPWNANVHISNAESNTVLNKSIRIQTNAGQPAVVAYAQQWAGARSAATLLLPANVLGRKYYAASFTQTGSNFQTFTARSQFQIIAVKPNTNVSITPRKNGVLGTPFVINLPNAGDMYQYQSTDALANIQDITGTLIESVASGTGGCLPIAVFSGSSNITFGIAGCTNGNSFDPLFQQLYPASTWGKNFGFVPFEGYPNGNPYRVMASENNTNVFFNGTQVATLNAGEIYPSTYTSTPIVISSPTYITSDKPICVSQFMQRNACSGRGSLQGDPDMVILNPIEQNISNITIFSSTRQAISEQFVNVLLQTTAVPSFRINNVVPIGANWLAMANLPGYSYLRYQLSGTSARLSADSGFNAIAYGLGANESYAYSAGTNVKDLYQQVGVSSPLGIENTPSVCTGSAFKFKVSLPYLADSIRWNLSNLPGSPANVLVTYSNPAVPSDADSSTVVNGRTVYWYSLPNFYNFAVTGTFPVSITTYSANTDGCGNEQIIDFELQISNPPIAGFTEVHNGCVGSLVQFTDQTSSTKPTYRWWWNFGDPASGASNSSVLQNPSHTFSGPGTYNVRFASITTPGCLSDTFTRQVIVNPLPIGNVGPGISTCQNAPTVLVFTGTVGTAPFTFTYNINNGPALTAVTTAGNSISVAVPTSTTGTFAYHLVNVRDAAGTNGCNQNIADTSVITVNPLPSGSISASSVALCQNAAPPVITFTGANAINLPYTFTYNINGGAAQTISTTSGNSVTLNVPTASAGSFVYNLVSVSDGSATPCVQAANLSTTILVNPLPTATIAGTTEVCVGSTAPVVTFTGAAGTAPYTFTYTLNGGPQQTIVSPANTALITVPTTASGNFVYNLLSVSDASSTVCGRPQTGVVTVTVFPLPVASFTIISATCVTRTTLFQDASTPGVGVITNRAWNFGDPASGAANTSTLQNPSHVYSSAGTYTATLSVTNDEGCVSILFSRTFVVSALPSAGFILPEVCLLDPFAVFTDTSSVGAPQTITGWSWTFGDPASGPLNTSTNQNAQHTYSAVGNYNVQLVAATNAGCTDTLTQVLTVNGGNPAANFIALAPPNFCANDSVAIQNKSTIGSGNITKVEIYWNNVGNPTVFETDDIPVFDRIYRHQYPDFQTPLTRTFQIRFRAYSGGVCVNDRLQNITVNASPRVQFAAIPNSCLNLVPFQITQATETGGVPGTGVFSGPGVNAAGLFDPSSVGPGTYTIRYLFTSTAGCVDSATQQLTVLRAPVASFAVGNPNCETQTITFTQTSSSADGLINTYTWNFGDGTLPFVSNTGNPVTHTYAAFGTYTASLTVTTNDGCNGSIFSLPVVVNPLPVPNFSFPASVCLPIANVQFTDVSSIADGTQNAFTYSWNFGDPASGAANTSTARNPTHIYNNAGPFNVTLRVTSGAGCAKDTLIVFNNLNPQPVAAFDLLQPNGICVGENASFRDQSTGANGTLQQWNWNFGDGRGFQALNQTPTYLYTSPGEYTVLLNVVNSLGCSDTASQLFTVNTYPVVNLGVDKFVLEGGSIILQPTVTATLPQYVWTPATYLNNPSIEAPTSTPLMDIIYTLTVTGRGGCATSDDIFVKVLLGPKIPNTFSPNGDGINERWVIEFLDTYPNCRVQVFTRTGQKVFESRGYNTPWNGTLNGKPLPIDTYYYIIEPENGRKPITGYVTIIK